ncbi:C-type lectin domain family 2 member D [Orchesella cincta]|uniref:C-type lectin domain family 2 member D n=1 Tax=Orchesella cincta TaxID=48709 RepID=A0A1D2MCV1_ORCCI|nr:C-type lectin domain family 2 member D [Orchesella cincta]
MNIIAALLLTLQTMFVVTEPVPELSIAEQFKMKTLAPGDQIQNLVFLGIVNGKNLFANDELRSWYEARDYCSSVDMEIAVINTEAEVNLLMNSYHGYEFSLHHWIAPVGLRNIPWRNMIEGTDICNAFYAGDQDDEFRIGLCEWGWRTLCQLEDSKIQDLRST